MDNLVITAASQVTGASVRTVRLGKRFGRMDLMAQLALLAVESLGINFETSQRDRIAICLAAEAGSLSTDIEYWNGRDAVGGPSPTLFAYTLASAAIGEMAIRHRLTGPNLCFIGSSKDVVPEAADLIYRGDADGCICVLATHISPALAQLISTPAVESACALFLQRGGVGLPASLKFDCDLETLCAKFCAQKFTT